MTSLEEKLALLKYVPAGKSHISLRDPGRCVKCETRSCTWVCPAGVYEWDDEERKLRISYENCLECGSCYLLCDNVVWEHPPGGTGVSYRRG